MRIMITITSRMVLLFLDSSLSHFIRVNSCDPCLKSLRTLVSWRLSLLMYPKFFKKLIALRGQNDIIRVRFHLLKAEN
jgi:hypothetical protein